jgi:hypothetical protein
VTAPPKVWSCRFVVVVVVVVVVVAVVGGVVVVPLPLCPLACVVVNALALFGCVFVHVGSQVPPLLPVTTMAV